MQVKKYCDKNALAKCWGKNAGVKMLDKKLWDRNVGE